MPIHTVIGINSCWLGFRHWFSVAESSATPDNSLADSDPFRFSPYLNTNRNRVTNDLNIVITMIANLPRQRIQEQRNHNHRRHNTRQVDGRDLVDFRIWRPLQVAVLRRGEHTEIGAAQRQRRLRVRTVSAAGAVRAAGQDQTGNEIAPKFGRLPGEEEEAEESHDNRVDRLIGDLGVDLPDLGEIRGLGRPHGSGAQTEQDTGRHQCVESVCGRQEWKVSYILVRKRYR